MIAPNGSRGSHATEDGSRDRPTWLDRSFQLAYVAAYRMMRVYWAVRKPNTHGALVLLWHEGEVLLVRNSYVRYHSLPGGYVRKHETSRQAALRELAEEIGVIARAEQLEPLLDEKNDWEGKRDHVEIFALEVSERPVVRVDRREVVEASWHSPEAAL
ncbi:MAG TPA: NUDIX hydrolase, partial [Polyangiaceae bacterium]